MAKRNIDMLIPFIRSFIGKNISYDKILNYIIENGFEHNEARTLLNKIIKDNYSNSCS